MGVVVDSSYLLFIDLCTYTHLLNSPLSRTTRMSRYQDGKTNLDLLEHICASPQSDNHASIPPLSF